MPAAVQALLEIPLIDLQGGSKAIATWRGKVLVINFWATWCAPCREEIPEFVRIQARLGSRGLQLVGNRDRSTAAGRSVRARISDQLSAADRQPRADGADAGIRKPGGSPALYPGLDRQGRVAQGTSRVFKEAKLEAVLQPLL
jgi:thiol-disulfide isomerase/thioredoxin